MVDRIRRAGAVSWALCGVAALVALIGLVAWVLRVIWPPLILAGAIVFLLNPVVPRLARRHIPRELGTAIPSLAGAGGVALVVVLLAPIATQQYDDLADAGPAMHPHRRHKTHDQPPPSAPA